MLQINLNIDISVFTCIIIQQTIAENLHTDLKAQKENSSEFALHGKFIKSQTGFGDTAWTELCIAMGM